MAGTSTSNPDFNGRLRMLASFSVCIAIAASARPVKSFRTEGLSLIQYIHIIFFP